MTDETAMGNKRRSPWHLLALPFILLGMAALSVPVYLGVNQLQQVLAPADTLLIVRPGWTIGLSFMPWMMPGISAGAWLFNAISYRIPPLRRIFEAEAAVDPLRGYAVSQDIMLRITRFTAIIAILCTAMTAGVFTAVLPNGLQQRAFPGLRTRQYRWNDIVEVRAICRHMRGNRSTKWEMRLDLQYNIIMSDGSSTDLLDDTYTAFPTVYAAIRPTLDANPNIRRSADITATGMSLLQQRWPGHTGAAIRSALIAAYEYR